MSRYQNAVVVVYATTVEEALTNARWCLERDTQFPVGYHIDTRGVVPQRVGTPEATALIDTAVDEVRRDFLSLMTTIRAGLQVLSDEDLFQEAIGNGSSGVRDAMWSVGLPTDTLLHQGGVLIRGIGHLREALAKWPNADRDGDDPDPYEGKEVWVVPARVHRPPWPIDPKL